MLARDRPLRRFATPPLTSGRTLFFRARQYCRARDYRRLTLDVRQKNAYCGGIFVQKEGVAPQFACRKRAGHSLNFGAKSTRKMRFFRIRK